MQARGKAIRGRRVIEENEVLERDSKDDKADRATKTTPPPRGVGDYVSYGS